MQIPSTTSPQRRRHGSGNQRERSLGNHQSSFSFEGDAEGTGGTASNNYNTTFHGRHENGRHENGRHENGLTVSASSIHSFERGQIPRPARSVTKHAASFAVIAPESTSSVTASCRLRMAEMTIDKLRFDKVGIVGRDTEARLLREVCQDTIQAEGSKFRRSLVLIDGAAGTGKSQLAQHVLEPLVARRGEKALLLQGKQLQHGQKLYAAITDCCEELSEKVLTSFSMPKLRELQGRLQDELGLEGPTLTTILPALEPLFGTIKSNTVNNEPAAGTVLNDIDSSFTTAHAARNSHRTIRKPPCSTSFVAGRQPKRRYGFRSSTRNYMEAKQRFNHAFRRFVRVICGFTSIVLLIDDLQWCDESSFELLENLLYDKDNSQLLVVGTVRGAELHDEHEYVKFQQRMEALADKSQNTVHVSKIDLGNLSLDATVQMLEELLSLSKQETILSLAKCVHGKTLGNAFYTVQFLTSLQRQKLLTFNFGTLTWTWDVEEIGRETTATENVADLVRAKMETLPSRVKCILPLMASLGSAFHLELLCMVLHHVRTRTLDPPNQETDPLQVESLTEECTNAAKSSDDFEMDQPELNQNERLGFENVAEQHPASSTLMTMGQDCDNELQNHAKSILMVCVEEGLIKDMGNESFRWIHDKVEEAALTMVVEEQLETMQFELASSLVEQMNEEQITEHISILVYLFRTSQQRLSSEDCLSRLIVRLKLESGLLALQASAFLQAAGELASGIDMLSQDAWETDYDVCLELYSTAAEVHVVIGKFDCVDKYVEEIEMHTQAQPLIHRQRAYDARVRRYLSSGREKEATSFLVNLLRKVMNQNFAKRGIIVTTIRKLLAAQKCVQANVETLSSSPSMCDEMKEWSMFLLDNLIHSLYQSGRSRLLPLVVLTAFELTLKSGITEVAPTVLVGVGGLICAAFPKHCDIGVMYAEQAVCLLDTMDVKRYEARTCFAANYMVFHHSQHVRDLQKGLLRGYRAGMAHGDCDMACYCMSVYLQLNFEVGAVFDRLARDCMVFVQETEELHLRGHVSVVECVWQSVLNLQGKSKDPLVLTGDVMNEVDWVVNNVNGPHWELFLGRYQLHVAVILGDFERAMQVILQYRFHQGIFEKTFVNAYTKYWLYFHMAIAAASMARLSKRFRFFRKLCQTLGNEIIKLLSQNGNPNILHRVPLVQAELADLTGQDEKAAELFRKSIVSSTRSGFRMDCAMAHERFADFRVREKDWTSAQHHYNEAMLVYEELGITLKVEKLQDLKMGCNQ